MTTVIIVDDQNSIREFLKINLSTEPDIEVIGMAHNGQAAIAQVGEHQPDIVLMDIQMPGKIDGIEATEIITDRFPQTKILLFTSQDNRQQLNRALKAGARGYVLKNTSVKDIGNIIRLTEKGFFQIGPILGNWDGSKATSDRDSLVFSSKYVRDRASTVIQPSSGYSYGEEAISNPSQMNHVLSNLTSGIFQLQETIKSQEDTIVNLTNQYSQVQQEIRTKLKKNKRVVNHNRTLGYNSRIRSQPLSQKKQHILFISSFFLGAFTVIFLLFIIVFLGGM